MTLPGPSRSAHGRAAALPWPVLVMVTDRGRVSGQTAHAREDLAGLVEAAALSARAGVDLIHVRERGLDDATLLALTLRIREAIAGTVTRLLVNDRIDVAIAAGADGVHLPARAVSCARARTLLSEEALVGRSVHSAAEAIAAARDGGCDYLVFGSVFESRSKPVGHPLAGLAELAAACAAVELPVLAIGGIIPERVPDVRRAGAAGIAAIGLFAAGADRDIRETVRRIRRAFVTA